MKTKEKLTASKEIAENVSRKFRELTGEELEQVSGGASEANMPSVRSAAWKCFRRRKGI